MARSETLPDRTNGSALFADISGFTALTEARANTTCTGQAGELPRPRGFSPKSGILPLVFTRQFPSPLVTLAVETVEKVGESSAKLRGSIIADLDRLLHEPARLMVIASLYVVESADYTHLMRQADITWGNLSAHISKLEGAGYIEVEKTYRGKRPYTLVRMSAQGRKAFRNYIERMKRILDKLEAVSDKETR